MSAFAELATPDPRTAHFVPGGLATAGRLTPDATVEFQRSVIESARLVDAVPETVREEFERLRALHVHGVIRYENFADVCNQAAGQYETALQHRFIELYAGREVPFLDRDGAPYPFGPTARDAGFAPVFAHIRGRAGIKVSTLAGPVPFNGMLDGLLGWARAERLLRGQRARSFERYVRKIRNDVSHGHRFRVEMPPVSASAIHDLAEFINQLWGSPTAGGRRYPAARSRALLAVGFDERGVIVGVPAADLSTYDDDSLQWVLVMAAYELGFAFEFDLRLAVASTSTDHVWGPGSRHDAISWLAGQQGPVTDSVETIDQLLLLRYHCGVLEAPRYPQVALALDRAEQVGTWYMMLADDPVAAWSCVRSRIEGPHPTCRCHASLEARGNWQVMLHRMRQHLPGLFDASVAYPRPLAAALPPDLSYDWFRGLPRRRAVTKFGA